MVDRKSPVDPSEILSLGVDPFVSHDIGDDERPSTVVVQALSAARMDDDLPPLDRWVDLEALDDFFRETLDGTPRRGDGLVAFQAVGLFVVVNRDKVLVYDR